MADAVGQMLLEDLPKRVELKIHAPMPESQEKRALSQARRIRKLFFARYKQGRPVNTQELNQLGGRQYQRALHGLRRDMAKHGYCIDRLCDQEMTQGQRNWARLHGVYWYELRPGAKSRFYKKLQRLGEI